MVKNARLNGVIVAGIMWVVYCICLLTGQYIIADILSPLCALFVFSSILSVAVINVRYRVPILFIAFGPLFWAFGDIVYLLNDFGFVADSEVVAISDPIYRVTSYAYVLGMIAFGFVQYSKKDMLRISVNTFLFSITTFIISIATFQMVTHEELTFAKLHPLSSLAILIAMFIIVFFLVVIASRAKRQISFYGLMVLSSFLLYGVLDIRYMMMDAVGLDASSLVVDALFLLSIVMLGFAYSTTSLYKLIYKTEKDTVSRSNAAGNVMAVVALIIGLLLCISGNMPVSRWFIMLIVAMAYFLMTKTIQLNDLNEMLIEQKENELSEVTEKLNNVSLLDIQTGLKNRRAWDRYGEDYVLNNSDRRLILYSIDANFFKLINNTYGAKVADKVLLEIGRRLLEIEDVGITTYRTDGDQFMVACEDVMGDVNAARFADYLMDVLDRPYEAEDKIIRVSFTIGAAIYPDDISEFDKLLSSVEIVRNSVTPRGNKSTCAFFDSNIVPKIQRNQVIESKLQDMDYDSILRLYYQPQISVETGEVIGMEALLRWEDPDYGYISPAEFVPIAESMGVMPSMGRWVAKEAFKQIVVWNEKYGGKYVIGINVSPAQLQEERFMTGFIGDMKELKVKPEWIDVELTEGIALNGIMNINDIIEKLKKEGVGVSVDDFGTGYAAFTNMINFHFNRLKIAKELIDQIVINNNARVIVSSIIDMAKGLNLDVIAEGVEEKSQVDLLKEMGCKQIQGFYYGKAIPAKDFEEQWLK